ncbi:MAG: hypothetical protein RLZZ444_1566 [Pseudomonadota bacterium]|jgi:two-component sensor histidine kinase
MARTLLYIDDDAALAVLAARKLKASDFIVTHAGDPEEAISLLKAGSFDAITLDHYMDGVTGLDFLEQTRDMELPPVVYVTGSDDASIAVEALKNGATDYFIKSTGDEFWPLLANVVEQAIEGAALKRAKVLADREIVLAKERAEILLAEVNHRVANSLALVASLIRLQISSEPEPAVKAALMETQARINAVAGMHRSLYTSDDVRVVDLDIYLGRLVNELRNSMGESEGDRPIDIELDAVQLSSDRAVSAGMIVTELITNAIKYAYPDGSRGRIAISLKVVDAENALIVVEDDGAGMPEDGKPKGTGLGTRITRSMAATIGNGIHYVRKDRGTRVEVHLTLV